MSSPWRWIASVESLLSAVSVDRMGETRTNFDKELIRSGHRQHRIQADRRTAGHRRDRAEFHQRRGQVHAWWGIGGPARTWVPGSHPIRVVFASRDPDIGVTAR